MSLYSVDDAPLPTPSSPNASKPTPPSNPAKALGLRAAEASVRPSPIFTSGTIHARAFDLANATFTLTIADAVATSDDEPPTEVFLPEIHFPSEQVQVEVSSGQWRIVEEESGGGEVGASARVQVLKWWHGEGEQEVVVRGMKRRLGAPLGTA